MSIFECFVSRDDEKVMQFELMQIHFPEQKSDADDQISPSFSTLRSFKTLGIVMNVFLLDPEARLLAGFVWISRTNSIGLYVLLDWNKEEYVFVDTGIQCVSQSRYLCDTFLAITDSTHPLVYHRLIRQTGHVSSAMAPLLFTLKKRLTLANISSRYLSLPNTSPSLIHLPHLYRT